MYNERKIMKNERAIEVIKNFVGCYIGLLSDEVYEAMELAIEALEQPQGEAESLDYQRAVEDTEYCEQYEQTYNPDDGSM